jgi:hypothetical protein
MVFTDQGVCRGVTYCIACLCKFWIQVRMATRSLTRIKPKCSIIVKEGQSTVVSQNIEVLLAHFSYQLQSI